MPADDSADGDGAERYRRSIRSLAHRSTAWRTALLNDSIRLARRRRDRVMIAAATLVVLAIATIALTTFLSDRHRHSVTALVPPTPPSPVDTSSGGGSLVPGRSGPLPATTTPPRPRRPITCGSARRTGIDAPDRVCVPGIGVDASVMELGLNPDRTVQVPPLSRVGDAGWYRYSALPGDAGPTVILGHVDSAQYGEGVFYRLGQLQRGDSVVVSRGDGMVATYRIDKVDQVAKNRFPTAAVYGRTSNAQIRLVTCGGRFDASNGNYLDNIIVFGTLRSLRQR